MCELQGMIEVCFVKIQLIPKFTIVIHTYGTLHMIIFEKRRASQWMNFDHPIFGRSILH